MNYKIKVIKIDEVCVYHVVNLKTNISHSNWSSLQTATEVMRDLNRMTKESA